MSDFQLALTNTAGISSVMSFWVFVAANGFTGIQKKLIKIGSWTLIVGFVALSTAIILRGFEAGRFPLANLYESLLWFAWAIMGGYIWINRTYAIGQLGWLASLTAATMFLYGSWLPANQHEIMPLVPALVSYWRQIHVPPLIVSYAMFFLSGLTGLLQLWACGRRQAVFSATSTIALCI
ncbi:MAG: cytochrome c biogenesis protein CcsA, partial [Candidatus Obscuribacterales bacterium]|nr:cytochrome c biogenesis protein CcsA [Candidatus Obscuribacterales bacterium]